MVDESIGRQEYTEKIKLRCSAKAFVFLSRISGFTPLLPLSLTVPLDLHCSNLLLAFKNQR